MLSARYEDFAHRAASLDHTRAIEALRVPGDHRVEAVYLRARDSRATVLRLRCSPTKARSGPLEIRNYAGFGR